jgi:hypothetical protein
LEILRPAGRQKEDRIEAALSWPLRNAKIYIVDTVAAAFEARLRQEMEKFPYWKDDGLDILSYVYDMIKDYRFPAFAGEEKSELDEWDRREARRRERECKPHGWMER